MSETLKKCHLPPLFHTVGFTGKGNVFLEWAKISHNLRPGGRRSCSVSLKNCTPFSSPQKITSLNPCRSVGGRQFYPAPLSHRHQTLWLGGLKITLFCDKKLCTSNQLLLSTKNTQKFQRSTLKICLAHGPSKIPIWGEMWEIFFLDFDDTILIF